MKDLQTRTSEAITRYTTPALDDEIQYHLDIDHEDDWTDSLYQILLDIEDRELDNGGRKLLTPLRRIFIELGVYRAISDAEIRNTQTLPGGRKFDFQLDGQKYTFDKHPADYRSA